MVEIRRLVADVHRRLERFANPKRRGFVQGYHPTKLRVLGAALPEVRKIARDVYRQVRDERPSVVLGLARGLMNGFEARIVANEILSRHEPTRVKLTARTVESLAEGLDNWASVDDFGCSVAGPAWREGSISDGTVHRWTRSQDRWRRRLALVSTVALNKKSRGGTGDRGRTLGVCQRLVDDHDDMVVKAMSWALRELIAVDRRASVAFLEEHEDALARRVVREVRNKLKSGRKSGR